MSGLDIANKRLQKEEELTPVEENILEEHTIFAKKNYMRFVEDMEEGSDNNFDGIINTMPGDAPSELTYKRAREYEKLLEEAKGAKQLAKTHQPHYGEIIR